MPTETASPRPGPADTGICYGAKAIAEHLGMNPRTIRYLVRLKRIPFFYEGSTICGARAVLNEWVAAREAMARANAAVHGIGLAGATSPKDA